MANAAKLQRLMDYITLIEPERLDQRTWASRISADDLAALTPQQRAELAVDPNICGTYGCAAGNAIALEFGEKAIAWFDGDEWFVSADDLVEDEELADGYAGVSIETAAGDILELDENEANEFFDGDNTLWNLWDMAEHFSGGRVKRPSNATIAQAEQRMIDARHARSQIQYMLSHG